MKPLLMAAALGFAVLAAPAYAYQDHCAGTAGLTGGACNLEYPDPKLDPDILRAAPAQKTHASPVKPIYPTVWSAAVRRASKSR